MKVPTRFCTLLAFLLLFLSHQTFPQTYNHTEVGSYNKFDSQWKFLRFESLTSDDGLPTNQIYDLCQDHRGFLWIGTVDGLIRYDGYNFKKFAHSSTNKNSLSNNAVYKIFEDSFGSLWIGTAGGLNKFNFAKQTFTHYTYNSADKYSISNNRISAIYEDKDKILWIGTSSGGLNKYDRENQHFIRYQKKAGHINCISSNDVTSISGDSKGNIWIGLYGNGIDKYDKVKKQFTNYKNSATNVNSLSSNLVLCVYVDSNEDLWIATEDNGLNKYNYINNSFIHFLSKPDDPLGLNSRIVLSINEFDKNSLLIGTGNGLNIFDKEKKQIIKYNYNRYEPEKIFGFSRVIIKDNSGLIWVGTDAQGIKKINPQLNFYHYRNIPDNPENLPHQNVFCICEEDDSTIWFGKGGGGLILFNFITGEYAHFMPDLNNKNSIGSTIIFALCKDASGVLWIGTYGGGLNRLVRNENDLGLSTFITYKNNPGDPESLSDNIVESILEDSYGELWVGTKGGGLNKVLNKTDGKKSIKFSHYKNDPNDTSSISSNYITFIYEDRNRELWIGTTEGLNKYIRDKNNFIRYINSENKVRGFPSNYIVSAYEDESNNFWIGTNAGLSKFDRTNGLCKNYSKDNGLPDEMIYRIEEDNKGNLWLSTNNGLSRFNPKTETFKNFDVQDGLQGNEFDTGASFKNKKGQIFFGGMNGLTIFHPDSIRENHHTPNTVLTDFQLNNISVCVGLDTTLNRTILNNIIDETEEIELYYSDKVISFEFSALDFHMPKKNKYAYMLEGFENNWNYTDAGRRFATYTNLDPGEYIFHVKGSNNDGLWNEVATSLKIIILPPWYQTTWAYLFYLLLLISAFYFTWRLQLKRIRIKNEFEMSKFEAQKLHEVDEMKTRFFTNISHEFRTPLTLIQGPAKQIIENTNESQTKDRANFIYRNSLKLITLVNQLLDLSKLEAGETTISATKTDVVAFIKEMVLSFTPLAERKKIKFEFNHNKDQILTYLDRDKFYKIINNILSNAFKFTAELGKIDISADENNSTVEIKISDTGVGIPPEKIDKIFDRFYQVDGSHTRDQEGTGIGLALTKELVDLHKGKIKVQSKEGEGSIFTISIPLGKDHLKPEQISEIDKDEYRIPSFQEDFQNLDTALQNKFDTDSFVQEQKPTLLVVEDNPDVRIFIKGILENDYKIYEAGNGEEGSKVSFTEIPDLIISDLMMPKMDGFEMCSKLKSDERTSHIPIIMLTAKATDREKIEGYETGADDYIIKPFNEQVLRARVKNLIEQRKKLKERFAKDGLFNLEDKNLTSVDRTFLKKIIQIVYDHISDTSFGVDNFASEIALSRITLHKKLVSLIGEPPSELIKRIRLSKAAKLLQGNQENISEIALDVGFSNPAYFSECFKKQFGLTPSQYQQKFNIH